jgi:glutathione S-transferase
MLRAGASLGGERVMDCYTLPPLAQDNVMAHRKLRLIGSVSSPFVRKTRIVAAEKKVEYTWEQQNPWDASTTVPDANPLGKVPVLVLDDGTALYDSSVICEFLDAASPLGRLMPADHRERLEVRRWEALADGMLDAGILARLESARAVDERSPAWIQRQMVKVARGLDAMERDLGSQPFCCGKNLTIADIAVGACLGWLDFRYPQLKWRENRENLARLAGKLFERPSFTETMPRDA